MKVVDKTEAEAKEMAAKAKAVFEPKKDLPKDVADKAAAEALKVKDDAAKAAAAAKEASASKAKGLG